MRSRVHAIGRSSPRRIVLIASRDAMLLDLAGPLEVFSVATRVLEARQRNSSTEGAGETIAGRDRGYALELVATSAGPVRTSCGIEVVAQRAMRDVRGPIDTLIVAGGKVRGWIGNQAAIEWVRRVEGRCRRVTSVCNGAFLLAAAGLLDEHAATTHWGNCSRLASLFPRVRVEPDRIYVREGRVATSAGVSAGLDLALALVEEDLGSGIAREVARQLVLFLRRPGGQSQFSAQLASPLAARASLRELQGWIHEQPGADLRVESLAQRMGMSLRHFTRVFTRELGVSPAHYVERARVEAARQWLEDSRASLDEVAIACGFGTAETLRRAFHRQLAVSPSAYRQKFASTGPPDRPS